MREIDARSFAFLVAEPVYFGQTQENYATTEPVEAAPVTTVATTMTSNTSKISTFLLNMNPICRYMLAFK